MGTPQGSRPPDEGGGEERLPRADAETPSLYPTASPTWAPLHPPPGSSGWAHGLQSRGGLPAPARRRGRRSSGFNVKRAGLGPAQCLAVFIIISFLEHPAPQAPVVFGHSLIFPKSGLTAPASWMLQTEAPGDGGAGPTPKSRVGAVAAAQCVLLPSLPGLSAEEQGTK